MNAIKILLTAALLSTIGCAHRAQHYAAPSSSAMRGSNARLGEAVVAAKESARLSGDQTAKQKKQMEAIAPKLSDLFRVAPPELRPLILSIQADVAEMQDRQTAIDQRQAELVKQLDAADAARIQHDADQLKYIADAAKITDQANAAEAGWAKDAAAIQWYRVHWFIGIIVMISGAVICALWGIFKFTAKTAIVGSSILK